VYHRPDQKEWGFSGSVTDDGRYLGIMVWHGTDTRNRFYYKDLESPNNPVVQMLDAFDADYSFVDNIDTTFFFRTDLDAPRGRVIAIDIKNPRRENWREIVPQSSDRLVSVNMVNNQIVTEYLKDAQSQVKIYGTD